MCRLWLTLLLLAGSAHGQLLEKLSGAVVFLQNREDRAIVKDGKRGMQTTQKSGTGFLVGDQTVLFLVTAEHVASDMKVWKRDTYSDYSR
jgi:hypothetical protein